MGSFDMACGVSGLSLGCGQPTKMFFIVEDPFKEWVLCYPTSIYKFCSFGIDMIYYDYGYYEFDESQPQWQEFVRFIKENAIFIPQGDNEYHEREFDPENEDHLKKDYLFDLMYHNRVKVMYKWLGEERRLTVHPFPIHKKVFDEVCLAPRQGWRGLVSVDTIVDEITEGYKKNNKEHCEVILDMYKEQLEKGEITQDQYDAKAISLDIMFGLSREILQCREFMYQNYSINKASKIHGVDALIRWSAEAGMLFSALLDNRIMVTPIMSAGQDGAWKDAAKFHQNIARIAMEIHHELDLDYEGDEE